MKTQRKRALFAALGLLLAAQAVAAGNTLTGARPRSLSSDGGGATGQTSGRAGDEPRPDARGGAQQNVRRDTIPDPPPRRPGKTDDELAAEAFASSINEALRKPREGETRVRAVLTRIECGRKGLVFVFKAGERQLRLNSAGFTGLHIVAYTGEAGAELSCGARKPEAPAVVTYRPPPGARPKSDGTLVALEFVPADFRLK